MSSRSLISSMATTVVSQAFHWIDILEKEFDKAFVDLDMLINENDFDQYEVADDLRAKMNTMNSCFAQLVHKTQTISQMNAKLEVRYLLTTTFYFIFSIFNRLKLSICKVNYSELKLIEKV